MGVVSRVKRAVRDGWPVVMVITAVVAGVAAVWQVIVGSPAAAVTLVVGAVLLVGTALVSVRVRAVQRALSALSKRDARNDVTSAAVLGSEGIPALRFSLEQIRRDEDLRHSEAQHAVRELGAEVARLAAALDARRISADRDRG